MTGTLIGWSEYDYKSYKDGKQKKGNTLYFAYSNVDNVNGRSCEAIANTFNFDKGEYKYKLSSNQLVVGGEYEFHYRTNGAGANVTTVLDSIVPVKSK